MLGSRSYKRALSRDEEGACGCSKENHSTRFFKEHQQSWRTRRGVCLVVMAALAVALSVMYLGLNVGFSVSHGETSAVVWVASPSAPLDVEYERYTVRMNTFRRNDLLKKSVEHLAGCEEVEEIQVVWSDQDFDPPPLTLFEERARTKVTFEKHEADSLNNRFLVKQPLRTAAVFSVDDDMIISCQDLSFAFSVWRAAPRAAVGFVPRLVTQQRGPPKEGGPQRYSYRSWWYTWWNGAYSIILTKACFLHKDHLDRYFEALPQHVLKYIDDRRNCEDIAMSFVVAMNTLAASTVWVKGSIKDSGGGGISAKSGHFEERGNCISYFAKELGQYPLTVSSVKAVPASRAWLW